MTAIGPTADPAIAAAMSGDDRAEAGRKLEAYFLRRMLAEVRMSSSDPLLSGGVGGKMFQEMLDEAMADSMAEAGGFGIAEVVTAQLGGPGGASPVASRSAATAAYQQNQNQANPVSPLQAGDTSASAGAVPELDTDVSVQVFPAELENDEKAPKELKNRAARSSD